MTNFTSSSSPFSKKRIAVGVSALLGIAVLLGFLVNYMNSDDVTITSPNFDELTRKADEKWSSMLIESVNAGNIRENLRKLTSRPHLAGTPADKRQAEEMASFWERQGLQTHMTRYNVLLSYPCPHHPNRIELQQGNGQAIFTTQLVEKILRPDQNQSDVVPPFNAYSAPGNPKGDLIYVNYGRIEDFIWLNEARNMDFEGKMCIARYGKIFRGDKAKHGQMYGCIGVILFSDPQQYSGGDPSNTYPANWWLPPTGVQRGTIKFSRKFRGDPLTPSYPSIDSAYRMNESNADLPQIPVHPIGYGDAYMLLKDMAGEEAPPAWQGGMNFTYRLGPGFTQPERKVQMFISTSNQNASIYNVFGIIRGTIEPDRYVLIGNHRDAWVFGAIDPSSGTAAMMELSRVFGSMLRRGWKPRRTIIFCSWAAEEYGLIGSEEFVEDYKQALSSRAVAYLNVDLALQGKFVLDVKTVPLLYEAAREAARKVPNPDNEEIKKGRKTVYDTWLHRMPELDRNGHSTNKPKFPLFGYGSDHTPFITITGITCASIYYVHDRSTGLPHYPLYHTVYETFHLVDQIMDPGFQYHKAVTQFWGELSWRLIDSVVLPMKATDYSSALEDFWNALMDKYGSLMHQQGLSEGINYLFDEIQSLKVSAAEFQRRLENIDKANPIEVRMYNDQLLNFERTFIDPLGLPGRPHTKNVVFALSSHNAYAGATFPGLVDSLFEIEKATGAEEVERWEVVKKELSIVTYFIHAAANNLKDFDSF